MLKKLIKLAIPVFIKDAIKKQIADNEIDHRSGNFFCVACSSQVKQFMPMDGWFYKKLDEAMHIHSTFANETCNAVEYSCPICNASDRDRLYATYIRDNIPSDKKEDFVFIDFAPSNPLTKFIKKHLPNIRYRTADLFMEGVDDKVDVSDMVQYENNLADFFICSHILEHVENDQKAMAELYRILKPGGSGIVMAPILLTLEKDYENPEAKTPIERWRHFGQDDHVRIYSKQGFIAKLQSAGFKVKQLGISHFGAELFAKYGLHPRSVLYVVSK